MSKALTITIAAIVGVVVLLGAGWFFFIRDDAPEAADIDETAASVQEQGSGGEFDGSVEGTWTVDEGTQTSDREDSTGTFAGFRIDEELRSIGATTAVGRTGDLTGTIEITGTELTSAEFEVDLTTITTDRSMRDDAVQEALVTGTNPTATFVLTEPVGFGAAAESAEAVEVDATGELTINGTTNEVTLPLNVQLVDGTIIVQGNVELSLADYAITAPVKGPALSISDTATLEVQALLVEQ